MTYHGRLNAGKVYPYLYRCPGCNEDMWEREDSEHRLLELLAWAIKGMRELSKDAAFQVRIQIAITEPIRSCAFWACASFAAPMLARQRVGA